MTDQEKKNRWGGTFSVVGDPAFYIFIDEGQQNWGDYHGGYLLIHELFHAAGSAVQYNHTQNGERGVHGGSPITGGWVTTHGHSSYRTPARKERDPRGAEMPLANPFAAAQSYVDWKFSQPLFIEGGDPFDYSSGREIDGLPVSEAEFQRRTGNGSAGNGVFVGGKFAGFVDGSARPGFSFVTLPFDVYRSGQPSSRPDWWVYMGRFDKDVALDPGTQQRSASQHSNQSSLKEKPQDPVHDVVSPNDCYGLVSEVRHIAERTHVYLAGPTGSDMVQNFMDQLARRFTEYASASELGIALSKVGVTSEFNHREFSDVGFKTDFQDHTGPGASDNQVRHTVGGLIAGYLFGDGKVGRALMDGREDMNTPSGQADTRLNRVTMPMGAQLRGTFGGSRAANLAEWIKNTLCNPI